MSQKNKQIDAALQSKRYTGQEERKNQSIQDSKKPGILDATFLSMSLQRLVSMANI